MHFVRPSAFLPISHLFLLLGMELFKGQEKEQEDSVALISAHDQEWRDTEFLQQQPRNVTMNSKMHGFLSFV